MVDLNQVKEDIRQYILREFLPGEKATNLRDDTLLRETGIVDSMGILLLVRFIEQELAIEIESRELRLEDFSSIDCIMAFVDRKMAL
jgi:acyl carrier protein